LEEKRKSVCQEHHNLALGNSVVDETEVKVKKSLLDNLEDSTNEQDRLKKVEEEEKLTAELLKQEQEEKEKEVVVAKEKEEKEEEKKEEEIDIRMSDIIHPDIHTNHVMEHDPGCYSFSSFLFFLSVFVR
jgi:hypothetical protein